LPKSSYRGSKCYQERPKNNGIELTVPVNANIAFSLHRLILPTNHTIEGLNGNLSIVNGTIYAIKLPEVNLCGLSFTAEAEKTSTFHYGYVELNSSQGDLLDLFSCLYPNEMPKVIFEGPFKLMAFSTLTEKNHSLSIATVRSMQHRTKAICTELRFL
jgi:hypothetical protein